jgi:hypothetical protein
MLKRERSNSSFVAQHTSLSSTFVAAYSGITHVGSVFPKLVFVFISVESPQRQGPPPQGSSSRHCNVHCSALSSPSRIRGGDCAQLLEQQQAVSPISLKVLVPSGTKSLCEYLQQHEQHSLARIRLAHRILVTDMLNMY